MEPARRDAAVLLVSVFAVGLCTIVYELLIGTVSSYLLGDSVTQFSLTIGLSMSAMGVGTFLSRYLRTDLLPRFLLVEILLGLLGGLSVPALMAVYHLEAFYLPAMIALVLSIGVLIGMEVPLLARILSDRFSLRANLSNVLSLDYLGALAASLLFPFVLIPFLGPLHSAPLTGLVNLGVAALALIWLRERLTPAQVRRFGVLSGATASLLLASLLFAGPLLEGLEARLYEDRVLLFEQSRHQRIVLTRRRDDVRLFLNGHLQFSTLDEHRYHEALVQVPAALAHPGRVLVLGGGDGLAVRELLRHDAIREVVLVDLDPAVTRLARENPLLAAANQGSLVNPRTRVVHGDAMRYLREGRDVFDLIIADLPDPNSIELSRLYSREFYRLVRARLGPEGVFATQATSPFFAGEAYWCILRTIRDAGFAHVHPYHAYVPSLGDWGFAVASDRPLDLDRLDVAVPTRFLSAEVLPTLFAFPPDVHSARTDVSTLGNARVLAHYLAAWRRWD